MSFIQQLQNISGNAPLSRRKALLGLSLLTLTACSRSATKAADSNVAYYTCTMHPFVRSQDPKGKCPICGMDLVPVMKSTAKTDAGTDMSMIAAPAMAATSMDMNSATTSPVDSNGMVNIAPERLQEIGATTEVVTSRVLTRTLRAPARAEIDESALRDDINVKAGAGYVTKLYASYEGATFRKGQPLMTVLCYDWITTQIDYIKSYRGLEAVASRIAE